jgi:hypothetical protein
MRAGAFLGPSLLDRGVYEMSAFEEGNPTFFWCFLRVSFRRGPPGTLSSSRGNSPRSFPRRRDHCRGASFWRCKALKPHLQAVFGRQSQDNPSFVGESGLTGQLGLGGGGAALWPQSSN